ncbi:hypothetical protein Lnau_2330 [Legionella nautarum]|uniref:Uncharacterized protein n=1 Tax=Legionella nautarum TaxID=45070 RepID=A0A0W0WML8_9GAMM|nr:hypothetical protein [Legionella nautarum]KTD33579.1 hypothetical protein Lnau_2330 [Legionella nautarum]
MENNKERILAYKLAKELSPEDLGKVAGGSVEGTVKVTGNSSSPDGGVDTRVDW